MMLFNLLIRRAEQPARADKSAVCAINRHLRMVGVVRQCGLLPRFVTFVSLVSLVTVVSGCYKGKIARGEQASRLACSSFSDTKMQSKVTGEGRCWHLSVSATPLRGYCCAVRQNERQLPCGSGEMQGEASPPPVHTSPAFRGRLMVRPLASPWPSCCALREPVVAGERSPA